MNGSGWRRNGGRKKWCGSLARGGGKGCGGGRCGGPEGHGLLGEGSERRAHVYLNVHVSLVCATEVEAYIDVPQCRSRSGSRVHMESSGR